MVAALYVIRNGPYYGISDVDPWDQARDARLYNGPHPVVAHPPCARWGRYWHGNGRGHRYEKGDDGGCFAGALSAVWRFGGVLEHPEASHAWEWFNLPRPVAGQQWQRGEDVTTNYGTEATWVVEVEQGHYGHAARKKTWLYAVGARPADIILGTSKEWRGRGNSAIEKMSRRQRAETPTAFRDYLLDYARSIGG